MRYLVLLLLFVGFSCQGQAQSIMSSNKKALKLFEQGQKLQSDRDFEGAIEKYNQAIQRDSSFAEAYRQAGAAYYILSKSAQALPYYAELAKRVPDAPRYIGAHLRIAEASFDTGNYQDALQYINKYLSFITNRDRYYQQAISIRNNCSLPYQG